MSEGMSLEQFRAAAKRMTAEQIAQQPSKSHIIDHLTDDYGKLIQGNEGVEFLVYPADLSIEIQPKKDGGEKYYLIIANLDWLSEDLATLEEELFNWAKDEVDEIG